MKLFCEDNLCEIQSPIYYIQKFIEVIYNLNFHEFLLEKKTIYRSSGMLHCQTFMIK